MKAYGVVAAAAMVLASAAPAMAADPPYGNGSARPPKTGELTLSYLAESGYAGAVKLRCDPPSGGHPQPEAACATLARVGADPDRIVPPATMCIMLYAPVTAQISGTWHGKPVNWTHRYGNRCEMARATGVLFAF